MLVRQKTRATAATECWNSINDFRPRKAILDLMRMKVAVTAMVATTMLIIRDARARLQTGGAIPSCRYEVYVMSFNAQSMKETALNV